MEELKPIVLKPNQDVDSIRIEIPDNGGLIVNYTLHTPSIKNSDSIWDDKKEMFDDDEVDEAFARIQELYKAQYTHRKAQRAKTAKPGPVKSRTY